ncbi:MAG: N-methyl-L-tryptophan oxidase [Saprospiraceae bacterium]|nr:N-methyl-L-tryptophan oxidase [Saprospiraceae bacterium]
MKRSDISAKTAGVIDATLSYSQLYARVHQEMESTTNQTKYDVIVIGVGSMGSSACYHLAKKGYKVLGLEQFDIPHEVGSHGGQSRIIRKAYGEASDYVPLLEQAYENWKTLESETGSQVYYKTGLVYFGAANNTFMETVKKSSAQYKIPVNTLTEKACTRKYPQFKIPGDFERLEEPNAGLLAPERSILLLVQQAIMNGAVIRTKEKVVEWKRENGVVTVKTSSGTYQAKKLVITAGAWAGNMIPRFAPKLKITRQALAWVKPKNWDNFVLGEFPCWLIENNGYTFYGFPILPVGIFSGPDGLKLGLHHPGDEVENPDIVERNTKVSDENVLIRFINQFMPDGYEQTIAMKTCLYTNSPDENFILDFLPGFDKDVVIATGFSGHGFKFASVIGEILADLAVNGSTSMPIGFLSTQRFDK